MRPSLAPGDLVLARRPRGGGLPPLGAIVLVRVPGSASVLVKRVASHGEASFAVASDNPAHARDSRHFGSLAREDWVGTATLAFSKSGDVDVLEARGQRAAQG